LEACDLHVKQLEKHNQKLKEVVLKQSEEIVELADDSIVVPWYVWMLIGGAGGVLAMEFAR
jgi:hypothetical protein